MTQFEYVATAHTLILTFAAARILAGVPNALKPRRLYWVHLSWLSLAIMFCLTSFWVFWTAYRDVEWTLPRLVLVLAAPGLIYVFSSIVVPADSSAVVSWREYFFSVRLPLFVAGSFMALSITVINQILVGASLSSQIGLLVLLGVFVVGAVSKRIWLHNVLALSPPLLIVAVLLGPVAQSTRP